ncbi:unnamed protein product, partial [Discosporangium mesarthrocarpum]
ETILNADTRLNHGLRPGMYRPEQEPFSTTRSSMAILAQRNRRFWSQLCGVIAEVDEEERLQTASLVRRARELQQESKLWASPPQGCSAVDTNHDGSPLGKDDGYAGSDVFSLSPPFAGLPFEIPKQVASSAAPPAVPTEDAATAESSSAEERMMKYAAPQAKGTWRHDMTREKSTRSVMPQLLAGSVTIGKRTSPTTTAPQASLGIANMSADVILESEMRKSRASTNERKGSGKGKANDRDFGTKGGKRKRSAREGSGPDADRTGDGRRTVAAFASLCIYAVRLGSVTKATVSTWARGIQRFGGEVTTEFLPGKTTQVVVDPLLQASTLTRHEDWENIMAWCSASMTTVKAAERPADGVVRVLEGNKKAVSTRFGLGPGTHDRNGLGSATMGAVSLVEPEWLVECLRQGRVVEETNYLLLSDTTWGLRRKSDPWYNS